MPQPLRLPVQSDTRTVLASIAFTRLDDMLVLCTHGDHPPSEADFAVWLGRLQATDYTKLLIHSQGGNPTPQQRARIVKLFAGERSLPKVLMLTDSVSARVVMTVFRWLVNKSDTNVLGTADLERGLYWLQYDGSMAVVAETIAGLRAALLMQPDSPPVRPRSIR